MKERLVQAAARLGQEAEGHASMAGAYSLRREQVAVFQDFARYLSDVVSRPEGAGSAFCRIILPPRTGKTIISGHIIGRSGLTATVIVPTRTLVEQTARVLRELLPGVAVGMLYGSRREAVESGVNITTYAFLERCGVAGIPEPLRRAELVFADEAHHAMTRGRARLLTEGFEPGAVRIALTATPDYDGIRRLALFFPDLVHEVDLCEAMELELLAPLRVWVAEVDEDASQVQFLAGDYQQEVLGRLMSSAPFFRATEVFRYGPEERSMSALIACASRQQAYDLHRYLRAHRPKGRPAPALLLGDTPNAEREEILARFERGEVDTLVQVGVLLEGWSSPRCKLLIDLAPTASRVRATQKSFRVMTRHGDAEARIYVLLPKRLPSLPVLPMDLFGEQGTEYVCGARWEGKRSGGKPAPLVTDERTPIAGVEVMHRLVVSRRFAKPLLDRRNARQIRKVLESCPQFKPDCGVFAFRGLEFEHPLFTGRGDFLLGWLEVPATRAGLDSLLGRLYPEEIGRRLLRDAGAWAEDPWCAEDVAYVEGCMARKAEIFGYASGEPVEAWQVLGGKAGPAETPEERLDARDAAARLRQCLGELEPRDREIVVRRFGLDGGTGWTLEALSREVGLSGERVRQILRVSLRMLKRRLSGKNREEVARMDGLLAGQGARMRRGRADAGRKARRFGAAG